jgi:ferredoxin
MKIRVDLTKCAGHGFCEDLAEDVFEVRSDGVSHVLQESPAESSRNILERAVTACPTNALSVSEK